MSRLRGMTGSWFEGQSGEESGEESGKLEVLVLEVPNGLASVPRRGSGDALFEDSVESWVGFEELDPNGGHHLRLAVVVAVAAFVSH